MIRLQTKPQEPAECESEQQPHLVCSALEARSGLSASRSGCCSKSAPVSLAQSQQRGHSAGAHLELFQLSQAGDGLDFIIAQIQHCNTTLTYTARSRLEAAVAR